MWTDAFCQMHFALYTLWFKASTAIGRFPIFLFSFYTVRHIATFSPFNHFRGEVSVYVLSYLWNDTSYDINMYDRLSLLFDVKFYDRRPKMGKIVDTSKFWGKFWGCVGKCYSSMLSLSLSLSIEWISHYLLLKLSYLVFHSEFMWLIDHQQLPKYFSSECTQFFPLIYLTELQ